MYRLITGGTIEEKVYHRQVYKQFLTNKVHTMSPSLYAKLSKSPASRLLMNDLCFLPSWWEICSLIRSTSPMTVQPEERTKRYSLGSHCVQSHQQGEATPGP